MLIVSAPEYSGVTSAGSVVSAQLVTIMLHIIPD